MIEEIETAIRAGQIGVGDHIESERSLAERLGVSRSSVREAIRTLSALGVVRSSVGSGPSAGAIVTDDVAIAWASALRLHVATRSLPVRDVVRTRVMVECGAYREVGMPIDPRRFDSANELVAAMDVVGDLDEFHAADAAFHLELVRLSGNTVATALMASLRSAIEAYVAHSMSVDSDWLATIAGLQSEHRSIVDALERGEGDEAAAIAERHILDFAGRSGLLSDR